MIKLLRQNKQSVQWRRQFTLDIICINFQVVFFADNFRECATLNEFHEEIFKLHFLLNQGRSIFEKKLVYKGRCDILFCYLVSFHTRLVRVTQHAVRHSLLKELAIAKTAKCTSRGY